VSRSFAVVCEARADEQTGCGLADRVFLAKVGWLELEMLTHCRQWRGFSADDPHLLWRNVASLARARKIRAHGHFQGEPGAPDSHVARLALLLLHGSADPVDAVVLLRDDDGQAARRTGLQQARRTSGIGVPIVIGLAHPKRECWVLAGFEPRNRREQDCVDELQKELGFDPRQDADRLNAAQSGHKRNAKHVLDQLTESSWERQAECWQEADLGLLKGRGANTGLADYLGEVEERLVPLLGGQPGVS